MKEVFEKIVERLEENVKGWLDLVSVDETVAYAEISAYNKAIEIVNQVAEEYGTDINVGSNDVIVNNLAKAYAVNLEKYGVDVTEKWVTATQNVAALNQAYMRGRQDERDRFDKLREEYGDGWIPCSERLPRRNTDVLVYRPKMAMPMLVDRYEGYYGEDDEEWHEGWVYSRHTDVIAWQPLPAPYQPKGE